MLTLTKELYNDMQPKSGEVVGAYSLPNYFDTEIIEWGNPDEQYNIKLDRQTKIFTGAFYDWNEMWEDWEDKKEMSDEEIHRAILNDRLLLIKSHSALKFA